MTALVVTIAWQAFAYRAVRNARLPVYDEPATSPEQGAMSIAGGPGPAVAGTCEGRVAYVESTRAPVVGARDIPEEKV